MTKETRGEGYPPIYIVLLNWNQADLTLDCLDSLAETSYPNTKIVLVDNGSTDDSLVRIREAYPEVEIIENGENLGYSPANNRGIEHALKLGAEYILLLNNDTVVAPDFLEPLVEVAESSPLIGVVSSKIYYFDEPERIWYGGGYIDWKTGLTAHMRVGQVDGQNDGRRGDSLDSHEQEMAIEDVNFVSACALFIKREVLESVGLLDERYFIYYDDTDWCARVIQAGFRCVYAPQSKIWHKVSAAMGAASPRTAYYMARNEILFLQKNSPGFRKFWLPERAIARQALNILRYSFLPGYRSMKGNRTAIAVGVLDALRKRFGKLADQL
jgi:GT2 family glycosyltransferase